MAKGKRLQPNRSTTDQRFACDDYLRVNLIKGGNGTVAYPDGASDESLAEEVGMTVWAIQKVRKARHGLLETEDGGAKARLSNPIFEKRLSALEKRFDEMIKWSHDVDRYLRRSTLIAAEVNMDAGVVQRRVSVEPEAVGPDPLEELLGSDDAP